MDLSSELGATLKNPGTKVINNISAEMNNFSVIMKNYKYYQP
jgi:hypothetical protein